MCRTALEVIFNVMRSINVRFTYLLYFVLPKVNRRLSIRRIGGADSLQQVQGLTTSDRHDN